MRRAVIAAAVTAAVAATLVGTAASGTAEAAQSDPKARRMLVISLPGVSWQDLNENKLPNLNRFFDGAAVADLTNRSVKRDSKLSDGYITLGAGTRSVGNTTETSSDGLAFDVAEPFDGDTAGVAYERRTGRAPGRGVVDLDIAGIVERNKKQLYDAEIGALGDAFAGAGWTRAVIANGDGLEAGEPLGGFYRRQAVTALMGSAGRVPAGSVGPELLTPDPNVPFGLRYDNEAVLRAFRGMWGDRSAVLVEASDLVREDAYRAFATPEQRGKLLGRALRRTDQLVGALLQEVDLRRDAVMIVGPTPPLRESKLTVVGLRGPGVEPGLLRTGTTRRSGFVQLIDLAPTILDRVGVKEPDSMEGRPAEVGQSGGSAGDRRAMLEDADAAARFRDDRIPAVLMLFVVVQVVLVIGALIWLARPNRPRVPTILQVGALASLGLIAAMLLARALPFHEWGDVAYWCWLAGGSLALAGLYAAARRRDALLPLMLALGVIVVVLLFDVFFGNPLQFNNPLGYSPRVAGRFSGYGNLAYAALSSSAVLLAGLIAHRIGGRRGALAAIGLLGVVFVADGAPFWGADVGGVLSILPAYGVTAYLLLGMRVRLRNVLLCGAAAVAAVLAFGAYDLTRPSDQRTHLGRLFETAGSRGSSGVLVVILRKLSENISALFGSREWLIIVVVGLTFLAYLFARHRDRLADIVRKVPEMRAAFIGFAILSVLGFALNDSGIAIPALMLAVLDATIITLLVVLRTPAPPPADTAASIPDREPVGTRA
ncbi:MAG: hypothetical protein M3046_16070 [Actinomycetota bacterium]|nr:hypothetical protein [Actinomycetota bacterium]